MQLKKNIQMNQLNYQTFFLNWRKNFFKLNKNHGTIKSNAMMINEMINAIKIKLCQIFKLSCSIILFVKIEWCFYLKHDFFVIISLVDVVGLIHWIKNQYDNDDDKLVRKKTEELLAILFHLR